MKMRLNSIISWTKSHEIQILYTIGVMIVGGVCFGFGVLKGMGLSQEPITVTRPGQETVVQTASCPHTDNALTEKDCKYVASAKGSKYYPPTCQHAKKIAKENLRCFKSVDDAKSNGYEASTSCKY